MGEKRHSLIRTDGYWLVDLDKVRPIGGITWQTTDMKPWWDHAEAVDSSPDGTAYGHKLELGGGPVDVSEWFPAAGRACANCGFFTRYAAKPCPHSTECYGNKYWKPCEQARIAGLTADEIMEHVELIDPPAIPPGEEGGRTMLQTWQYEVWQKAKMKDGKADRQRKSLVKNSNEWDLCDGDVRERIIWTHKDAIDKAGLLPHEVEVLFHPFAR